MWNAMSGWAEMAANTRRACCGFKSSAAKDLAAAARLDLGASAKRGTPTSERRSKLQKNRRIPVISRFQRAENRFGSIYNIVDEAYPAAVYIVQRKHCPSVQFCMTTMPEPFPKFVLGYPP